MSVKVSIIDGIEINSISGLGGANEGHLQGFADDVIDGALGGVRDLDSGDCAVSQNSPADMQVLVADGVVYVPNDNFDASDIRTTKLWRVVIKDEDPLVISANSSGSTRVDLICVYVNKTATPDEYGGSTASLVIVAGTPGAGAPALPSDHYSLAEITVVNGATEIETADITDARSQITLNTEMMAEIPTNGWTEYTAVTPVYVSASSIKFTGIDLTAVFQKGTHIRLKQGSGYKYYDVLSASYGSGDTTIGVIVNTDYTVANSAITDVAYSYEQSPEGYPTWFNYTSTPSGFAVGNGTLAARYSLLNGQAMLVDLNFVAGSTSSFSGIYTLTAPVTMENLTGKTTIGGGYYQNGGSVGIGFTYGVANSTTITFAGTSTNSVMSNFSSSYPFGGSTGTILSGNLIIKF